MIAPYEPRDCQYLETWQLGDWRMKAYGIRYGDGPIQPQLLRAAKQLTADRLSESADVSAHYHVGYVGVHQGKTAHFIFVDWWADENELHHHVYVAPLEDPTAFRYTTPSGLIACVWDMKLMAFERDAWVDTVLANPAGSVEDYLARHMNGPL